MNESQKTEPQMNESSKKHLRLVTAESVRAGHPDKFCDQIADAILDAHLSQEPNARVAVEVFATEGKIIIGGEVTSKADVDCAKIVENTIRRVGYGMGDLSEDPEGVFELEVCLHDQSPDIAAAVNKEKQGAGDQGIMVGYATDETHECMPLPVLLAHRICRKLDELQPRCPWMGADGKAQVTVAYENDKPVAITALVISVQHDASIGRKGIMRFLGKELLGTVLPTELMRPDTGIMINPSGAFMKGGPAADTGLTGRKLAVDQYGPVAHIGGGALSGKDASKVDRSGAYAARWVAKNIVAAGMAKRCEVQIAYAIGQRKPVSVSIDTFGTAPVHDDVLINAVKKTFDLRPGALIEHLKLREVRYAPLAAYGHFGRADLNMPWENADMVDALLSAVSDSSHHRRRADRYA